MATAIQKITLSASRDIPFNKLALSQAGGAELVNYRVRGNHMIIDRLFAAAELRLGGEHQQKVRIVRTDGRRQS